jgi:hypothetical protein
MCFVVQCCKPPLEITVRSIWLVAAFYASHFHHASTIASHGRHSVAFFVTEPKKGTRFIYAEDLARQRDVAYSSYLNIII